MTLSDFAKILKGFADDGITNGSFLLEMIDESLEDVKKEDEEKVLENNDCLTYNPLKSEDSARKYFDGSRKILRKNFEIIGRHFERSKFSLFLKEKLLKTDDNYRHLVLKLKDYGIESSVDNVVEVCCDIFDKIIVSADKEYKKTSELNSPKSAEQEEFKEYVYNIFQKVVEKENWPFRSSKYKIFKDELYELVGEDIDERFDIAIENYNGDNKNPALTLLVKCKKSNAAITKDELRILNDKIKQVSGCCKAILTTNASVEKDTLWYAQKMGIGILRFFNDEKIKWLAPRKMYNDTTYIEIEKCNEEIEKSLLQEDYEILNNFATGYFEKYYGSISSLFNKIFTGYGNLHIDNVDLYEKRCSNPQAQIIDYVSTDNIKDIANQIHFEMYGKNGTGVLKVDTNDLIDYLKKQFDFDVVLYTEELIGTFPQRIQGLVDYLNKKILIYGTGKLNKHILKFSIAHEISHLILHKDVIEQGKNNFFYFYSATKESKRMEKQANLLASYIILNDNMFRKEFLIIAAYYHLKPRKNYYLYLDSQPCNINQFLQITDKLIELFDVSREQIKIRLSELGWLTGTII